MYNAPSHAVLTIAIVTLAAACPGGSDAPTHKPADKAAVGQDASGSGSPASSPGRDATAAKASAADDAAAVDSAATGMVSGTVRFSGEPRRGSPVRMNADPYCAAAHSEPVIRRPVTVGDGGGLLGAVVYISAGLQGRTFAQPTDSVELDQNGCMYTPLVFAVRVGQTVDIRNSDSTLHNVHSLSKESRQFNLAMPVKGMSTKKKFTSPEVFIRIKCDVHPWMETFAAVIDHPFFAVTGADGAFTLDGVPAGTYTVTAAHPKLAAVSRQVEVGADGKIAVDFSLAPAQ